MGKNIVMHRNAHRGVLVVIEGTDGSGKETQTKLLVDRLEREGYRVETFSFPQYGKKSAGMIEEYLAGAYGDPETVSPYVTALFYALDRFDAASDIRAALESGAVVVLDRYVDSNAGHQGGKITDLKERENFLSWLYEIEYGILGVPKPDHTILLHMPAEVGQALVRVRQQRRGPDGHEEDLGHLERAEATYLWLAARTPQAYSVITCVEDGNLLSPQAIHERVWGIVQYVVRGAARGRD